MLLSDLVARLSRFDGKSLVVLDEADVDAAVGFVSLKSILLDAEMERLNRQAAILRCRIVTQAWVDGNVVEIDPAGPAEWCVPVSDLDGEAVPDDCSVQSDRLREHTNAPDWVLRWNGPFDIYVTNREELDLPVLRDRQVERDR